MQKRVKKTKKASKAQKSIARLQKLWWVIPLLLIVASGFAAWSILKPADKVVSCTNERLSDFKCWQQHYQTLVMEQDPKAAFADFRKQYEANPYIQSNCHQIAHVIGRAGGKKYKDIAEAFSHGDDFCSSGYYHGVMESVAQKVGIENIKAQIPDICEPIRKQKEFSLPHFNCVHGLGHGLMSISNDKVFESIALCEKYQDSWQQQSCAGGVYMENVMTVFNNPDYNNEYLKKDDPLYPCTVADDRFKAPCYTIQTAYPLNILHYTHEKVFELCGMVAKPFDDNCYQSLGRDISGNSIENIDVIKLQCNLGQDVSARRNCYTGAVKDVVWYRQKLEPGIALCNTAEEEIKNSCVAEATAYYNNF